MKLEKNKINYYPNFTNMFYIKAYQVHPVAIQTVPILIKSLRPDNFVLRYQKNIISNYH